MKTENLLKELNKGILCWYPFREHANILIIQEESSVSELFQSAEVCTLEEFERDNHIGDKYDYIIVIQVIEKIKVLESFFSKCKGVLHTQGKLLFSMDNRLGLRYFCGDRDPYTNRNFDSIEEYRRVSALDLKQQSGRIWDKASIERALHLAGFSQWQSFSVFPNIEIPQLLYAEDYLPEEDLSMRYFPMYHYPDSVFLEEAYLYDSLIKNNLFHQMANGYLFECSLGETLIDIKHVTLSMDRGENAAMATMIEGNQKVWKKALYPLGVRSLQQMQQNHFDLKARGILVVDGKLENDMYQMPYIEAELANVYLQNLLRADKDAFIKELDRYRELILQSSEHVAPVLTEHEEQVIIKDAPIQNGVWLRRAYFDLVPLNAFYINGNYMFFDQEFYVENYPANALVVRMLDIIYGGHTDLEAILPISYFWKRYELEDQVNYLRMKSARFLSKLRHQDELRVYNEKHGANLETIHSNRQKMNFSSEEYQKIFVNIFDDLEKYKLYIFGSGLFAKKFIELYGEKYEIQAILDNNEAKWGTELNEIKICSPKVLYDLNPKECKVLICIKSYLGVMQQLKDMGMKHIGVYDTNMVYPVMQARSSNSKDVKEAEHDCGEGNKKKYRTGYIAGVFDLYHIGHLNMFRRAKEQCEYLIVGVVSDEGVRKNKKVDPFIPFEERIEMVRSCKYVDEAVAIPVTFCGSRDAYRLYHFDVQFSGSDYVDDPVWLAEKAFLEKNGAELVFFPYTEQTSSTKIKALINKQLEE